MTTEPLNPDALAEAGDEDLDSRPGVQRVTEDMIYAHVTGAALPPESARPFAVWLDAEWYSWNEDGAQTVGTVLAGALAYWRGTA
ncbi:hypothetical protein [Streptomyces sp. NPDC049881]|uniref:hypothetical protein n=1 Tax=Streptomyces sp. NPDC049881 TaxID=3155778 RepID=UPI00343BC419